MRQKGSGVRHPNPARVDGQAFAKAIALSR